MIFKNIYGYIKNSCLTQDEVNSKLIDACYMGELKDVQYWLKSHEVPWKADINCSDDLPLRMAFGEPKLRHREIVKYLLCSSELKIHANIHADYDKLFISSCEENDVEMVKFLLTSPLLKEHIDIHTGGFMSKPDLGFETAYKSESLDVMRYLLHSSDLTNHINLSLHNDIIFKAIYRKNSKNTIKIMNFLILEADLEKTVFIEQYLKDNSLPNNRNNYDELTREIEKIFNKKQLKEKLDKILPHQSEKKKNILKM